MSDYTTEEIWDLLFDWEPDPDMELLDKAYDAAIGEGLDS